MRTHTPAAGRRRATTLRAAALAAAAAALLPAGPAAAASLDLTAFRNHVGICSLPADTCNFDEVGYGYSAQALLLAGVQGGSAVEADGITYTWPTTTSNQRDNVTLVSQTIPVGDAGDATRVGFLGAAHHGPVAADVVLRYASTDPAGDPITVDRTHRITFSDWTLAGGGAQPSAGNTIAVESLFRAFSPAVMPTTTYAFSTTVPIDAAAGELQAVVLPRETRIRLFDIALG